MLNKNILKIDLMTASEGGEFPDIWHNIADVINDYLETNGFVQAVYLGNIPGTPPVPSPQNLTPHLFRISSNIQGAALAAAAQGGLQSLIIGLATELSKSTVGACTTPVFTMPPVGPLIPIGINLVMDPEDDHEGVMGKFAEAIVNAFFTSLPAPPTLTTPAPVTAIDGSIGVLTFNSIT